MNSHSIASIACTGNNGIRAAGRSMLITSCRSALIPKGNVNIQICSMLAQPATRRSKIFLVFQILVKWRFISAFATEGRVVAVNDHGEKLRQVLLLDSESNVSYRSRWMRTLALLQQTDAALYQEYMAFPEDLPDLRAKRVKENTRPDGAVKCFFVLRESGELPATY